ncbi:MAG: tetratricopeptide repeat protein [Candidatus Eremiobacteraeota bacterium]|nr:tetratricopeptide repeat protein [Candidatus Eremiobacteraeota bacterium]
MNQVRKIHYVVPGLIVLVTILAILIFVIWSAYRRNKLPSLGLSDDQVIHSDLATIEAALKRNPSHPGFLLSASERLIEMGESNKAKKYLEKVIKQNPGTFDEARGHILLCREELRKAQTSDKMENFHFPEMPENADNHLKKASRILENIEADPAEIQKQRYLIAEFYWDSNMFDRAIEEIKKGIAIDPDSIIGMESRVLLAHMRGLKGEREQVIPEIDKIAGILEKHDTTDYRHLYCLVGQAYFDLKFYDKALPVLKNLVRRWPDSNTALMARIYLAWIMGKKGQDEKAINYLKDVIYTLRKVIGNRELDYTSIFAMMLGSSCDLPVFLKKSKIPPGEIEKRVENTTRYLQKNDETRALMELEKLMNSIKVPDNED